MVNQMLLKLFRQFGAKNLQVFCVFARLLVNLHDLFIYVSAEEVGPLGWVLLSLLDFLKNLTDVAILALLYRSHLVHHILEQVLHQLLGLLITVHALINLHTDHLAEFVRYLQLAALEAINFILDSVVDFGDFSAYDDFLLRSGHLLLPDPAVDAPDLGLKIRVEWLNSLILTLELVTHIGIHLVVALAHLFDALSALLSLHTLLQVHLVAHIIDLPTALFLLAK